MKNYVMFGAAGFVAPRHMKAIADTGGNLVAVVDPSDSVGILDSYFPECRYFREFERFERFCSSFMEQDAPIDYVVVCSPNYLHDAHCAFGLRLGAEVICEKPVTVRVRNLDRLMDLESKTESYVHVMYQLRCSPMVQALKDRVGNDGRFHQVKVQYVVKRGNWFESSWKGDIEKSGWIPANIGTHVLDILSLLFGEINSISIDPSRCFRGQTVGTLTFERARVTFEMGAGPYMQADRRIQIDDEIFTLAEGHGSLVTTGLHTKMYEEILFGKGVGLAEARQSVLIADELLSQYQGWKGGDLRCAR